MSIRKSGSRPRRAARCQSSRHQEAPAAINRSSRSDALRAALGGAFEPDGYFGTSMTNKKALAAVPKSELGPRLGEPSKDKKRSLHHEYRDALGGGWGLAMQMIWNLARYSYRVMDTQTANNRVGPASDKNK
jgi:hypothetical protein